MGSRSSLGRSRRGHRGPVARTITTTGAVDPVITVQVGAYVSGTIQTCYCDYNAQVKAGQLCAKIDPCPYQVVVDQDAANLAKRSGAVEEGPGGPRLCEEKRAHEILRRGRSRGRKKPRGAAVGRPPDQWSARDARTAGTTSSWSRAYGNVAYARVRIPPRTIPVTGIIDADTQAAIFQFPRAQLGDGDGRIDPGGATLRQLNAVAAGPPRSTASARQSCVPSPMAAALDATPLARG